MQHRPVYTGQILGLVTSTRTARYRAVPSKIGRRRPILKEIDRRRSIEEDKGKKKRKRKKKRGEERIPRQRRPCPPTVAARGRDRDRFFSRARRRSISPREETDRGDIRALLAYEVAALLLRCCDAAAVLPLRHFATVMLQWRCLFAAAMLLLPFNAAVASQVSLHFSSFSFFFFFLLPLLFLHRTFLINLFFSLVQTPVRTDISYVGTSVWSGTT
ncbi:hypothetical protein B296_00041011 [Ensete ventricosum]|uniref:Uncharacterized protein n=1 Tax=Ensete ventricosum TaxID=4639 RepID=A0A426XZ94_ENSVE|nr:hypothetical protein B296_00041011 [Ensete ventricosum]